MNNDTSIKRSVAWSAIEKLAYQGVQFLMTIIISRFVAPDEFGLVAMLSIFLAVSNSLIDCGFSTALIQKQDRTEEDYSTAFYTNLFIALAIYAVLYCCSPAIALFYREPRLVVLTRVICLTLILRSLCVVQNAKLIIALDFKTQTKATVSGALISGIIGIYMAIKGYGVWAIVAQALIGIAITTILLWFYSRWKPVLIFSKKSFILLFGFGSKLMLSGLMHTIYLNLYTLVIGKFYNATDVGYYNRASTISQYPSTNIVSIINRVFFPVLCQNQDNPQEFSRVFHGYLRMSCFIVFPISIAIASLAKPLIRLILTEKWDGAIVPVQIIAIAYMLYPVLLINNQPLQALNHTTMFFYAEIIKKIVALVLLFTAVNYGLTILCFSVLAYNICDTIIILFFTRTIMQTGFRRQLKELVRPFLASILMGLGCYFCVRESHFGNLATTLLGMFFCLSLYGCLCWILRIEELYTVLKLIKKYV